MIYVQHDKAELPVSDPLGTTVAFHLFETDRSLPEIRHLMLHVGEGGRACLVSFTNGRREPDVMVTAKLLRQLADLVEEATATEPIVPGAGPQTTPEAP